MKQLISILFLPFFAISQSSWEKVESAVFMENIRNYEQSIPVNESYSMETEYKIYNDYSDEQYIRSFEGKMLCKSGKELNVYQMEHLMIQNESFNITIDTVNRQMMIQHPDPSFFYRKTVQDYTVFSEIAETVYRRKVNDKTGFMLELKKGFPYRAMEFTFSDTDVISQIVIYSNQPYYEEGDTYSGNQAKIVLDFKNLRKGKAVDLSGFIPVNDCIDLKNSEIKPIGKFRDFEIVDLRN